MELTNKQAFNGLVFILSSFILIIFSGISFIVAWAHEEGTIPEPIGLVGYYLFYIFRFPTHNFMWSFMPDLHMELFFYGLFVNVLIYAALATIIISKILKRKELKELNKYN